MSLENTEQVAQPEAAPAMETPSEVASGGSGNEFLNMIPEELRGHPSISPIKDVENEWVRVSTYGLATTHPQLAPSPPSAQPHTTNTTLVEAR